MAEEHKGMGALSFDFEINSHVLMDCDEMICTKPEENEYDAGNQLPATD